MSFDNDLADFFDVTEFAVTVTRSRLLADDVTFTAIPGAVDQEALDGRVVAPMRQIAYATGPDVIDGDIVTLTGTGAAAVFNGSYRVHQPERVNDGAESRAFLQLIPS
jgi:hypothetical protein